MRENSIRIQINSDDIDVAIKKAQQLKTQLQEVDKLLCKLRFFSNFREVRIKSSLFDIHVQE